MKPPTRQRVTASGTATVDDPTGPLVFNEDYEILDAHFQNALVAQQAQATEIRRLEDELAAMIKPLEHYPDRADVWINAALSREGGFNDVILADADRLLAEYDKRFTDPEAGYVDILFNGPPTTGGAVQSMVNQNGIKAVPGDWIDRGGDG